MGLVHRPVVLFLWKVIIGGALRHSERTQCSIAAQVPPFQGKKTPVQDERASSLYVGWPGEILTRSSSYFTPRCSVKKKSNDRFEAARWDQPLMLKQSSPGA
jgi:hypothetical protein